MYKDTQSNPKATSLHLKFIFSLAHKKILAAFFEQSGFLVCAYKIANISPTEFIANLFRLLKVYDVLLHISYDFVALHLASLIL